jgi:molybdopterin molybdotransferase
MDQPFHEIDEGAGYIGYCEAFELVCATMRPLGIEEISLESAANRISAKDTVAPASYPSIDVSLKDGFAVKAADVLEASSLRPISLKVIGSAFAGSGFSGQMSSGCAVKICSGAPIPFGADAVAAAEFCREISNEEVHIKADAGTGRNILQAGSEVKAASVIVRAGDVFLPGNMGLAAASGINRVRVYKHPKAAIVGIGDEVVAPGQPLLPGQLYASNLVTMRAWMDSFGLQCVTSVVKDNSESIVHELERLLPVVDAILTSGGAWGSERDLVVGTLEKLGWHRIFHHVRMGPGKGIAFGLWKDKPVFCLPGGPASNEMAFLQLALPGILCMAGDRRHPLPTVPARLVEDVKGRLRTWTEFKDATLSTDSKGSYSVRLYRSRSRLQAIAGAHGLICMPEGIESLISGDIVPVQVLSWEHRCFGRNNSD